MTLKWRGQWHWAGTAVKAAACFVCFPAFAVTVVLDAGHTESRPGVIGPNGGQEYDYNIRLTDLVAGLLESTGVTVVRPTGKDLSLTDRTRNTYGADLFVSIHHDSIQQAFIDQGRRREFAGFSIFVSTLNRHWNRSQACAQSVGRAMIQNQEHPSLYHAAKVKGENRPFVDKDTGVHRFDDLVVLRTASSPAILIEAGVIANPDEERRLASTTLARRHAHAIAVGILNCLLYSSPSRP